MREDQKANSFRTNWINKAIWLSWFTIVYNLIEGFVSIGFGINGDSVSLAGFGVDSLIEVASALLVLWRFKGEHLRISKLSIDRERKATFGIGILFLFLAIMTSIASGFQIYRGSHPETTVPGVIVALISLSFMFYLWRAKLAVSQKLQSITVKKDASCSLACIKLSAILLIGSLLFLALPQLWWVDGVMGIFLSLLIGKEGWETVEASRAKDFMGGCGCD